MGAFGYIFIAQEEGQNDTEADQRRNVQEYVNSLEGGSVDTWVVERDVSYKKPFRERDLGKKILEDVQPGSAIIVAEAKHILGSASEATRLLRLLRKNQIALHCAELGMNISVKEKRRLVVSEGSAELVEKLLDALAVCESCTHGDAIRAAKKTRKKLGKYLGGPVPFGWQVNEQGVLIHDEEQQRIIDYIEAMRADRWSYRDISRKLKEERGVMLSHEGVRRIISSNRKATKPERI